ncbi:MAG: hypothetical protein AVDCRST_MAG11-1004, partial [uncultured Gemmatimonadaceae bacterium]
RARLERAGDRLLPRARRGADGRVDGVPPNGRGARPARRARAPPAGGGDL